MVVVAIQCWDVLEGDKNCQSVNGVIMNIPSGTLLPSYDSNYDL